MRCGFVHFLFIWLINELEALHFSFVIISMFNIRKHCLRIFSSCLFISLLNLYFESFYLEKSEIHMIPRVETRKCVRSAVNFDTSPYGSSAPPQVVRENSTNITAVVEGKTVSCIHKNFNKVLEMEVDNNA